MATSTADVIDEVVATLDQLGQRSIVALAGVPGTGKSYIAAKAATAFAGHQLFVETVQFHQAYGYEEFIEGLRPTSSGGFSISDGVLLRWNDRALADPDNKYVLLIEELTRANLSAVMGELLTLIEYRDRLLTLPFSKRGFQLAQNLYVLATFNPHDRNAIDIDDAFLRRIAIIDCPPSSAQLIEMLSGSIGAGADGALLLGQLAALFDEIEAMEGERFTSVMPFGHGLFAEVGSEDDLRRLWRQRIRHFIARPNQLKHELADAISSRYPWK